MTKLAGLLLAALFCLTGLAINAEAINKDAGTSAFSFLKINVGARPVAMGAAFTGLADDISALYYNPAGIASIEYDRYVLGYHSYFVDMQSGFVGYVHPLDFDNVLGGYITYLNYGEMTETDLNGDELGTFSGGDLLIALSYARNFRRNYQLGISSKFIYEKIQDYSATGLAFDIGARYKTDRGRFMAGLMVQNLGTQLSSLGQGDTESLPLTFRLGASVKPRDLEIILSGDIIMPSDNDLDFAVGGEYYHLDPFFIRAGWNGFGSNYRKAGSDDAWAGLSLGIGLQIKELGPMHNAQLSYSYTPAADLGTSHRITLTGGR